MRRHVFRTLLVGCATAAAVALGTGQAFAADTITITGAGGPVTAFGALTLGDASSGQTFSCPSSGFSGSLANVSNAPLPYNTIRADGSAHSITSWRFGGCTSSFGSATLTVPATGLPDDWVFTTVSPIAPQASGFITVLFHISVLTCSYDVAGQADFTWTNGTSNQLRFTGRGTLHAVNISAGCFGLVSSADVLTLTGTLTVTPPIVIS